MQNMMVLIYIYLYGLNNLDSSGVGNWVSWFRVFGDWGIFLDGFLSFLIINVKQFSSRKKQSKSICSKESERKHSSLKIFIFPTKVGQSRRTDSQIPGASTIGKSHTINTTFETTTVKWPQGRVYRLQPITSDFSSQPKPGAWAYQVKGIWKELLHFQNINTGILHHHLPKNRIVLFSSRNSFGVFFGARFLTFL